MDGLLFKYKHFYGSYDYRGASDRWYAHEVRVVRAVSSVKSFRDAQGFRIRNNEPLRVLPVDATVHHYGWVKPPQVMQDKRCNSTSSGTTTNGWKRTWWARIVRVRRSHSFAPQVRGPHPQVMQRRVAAMNWTFSFDRLRTDGRGRSA